MNPSRSCPSHLLVLASQRQSLEQPSEVSRAACVSLLDMEVERFLEGTRVNRELEIATATCSNRLYPTDPLLVASEQKTMAIQPRHVSASTRLTGHHHQCLR